MRIAVIGAGNVGGSLGRGWSKRGHQVRCGVPNPADAKYRDLPAATPAVAAADADAISSRRLGPPPKPLSAASVIYRAALSSIARTARHGSGRARLGRRPQHFRRRTNRAMGAGCRGVQDVQYDRLQQYGRSVRISGHAGHVRCG
jgi:hypothetical protein